MSVVIYPSKAKQNLWYCYLKAHCHSTIYHYIMNVKYISVSMPTLQKLGLVLVRCYE